MDVLLVEDNEADAYLLRELVAEKPDAPAIHWVSNGYEAMAYMRNDAPYQRSLPPDLILLDLGLPRISGYEVLKELKGQPHFSAIPVIILTTSRNPMDRSQCLEFGADAFISKPYNLKEYEALAEQLISEELPRLCRCA